MKKLNLFLILTVIILTSVSAQLFPTDLVVFVRNELGNLESGVTVSIYKTKEDYEKSENAVSTQKTDAKGKAVFENVDAIEYYVSAEKGDMNNFGAGEKTGPLTANKSNKVTIIISE